MPSTPPVAHQGINEVPPRAISTSTLLADLGWPQLPEVPQPQLVVSGGCQQPVRVPSGAEAQHGLAVVPHLQGTDGASSAVQGGLEGGAS
jgi:hypothetical protein